MRLFRSGKEKVKTGKYGDPLLPFCGQCGGRMHRRRGGISGDIVLWECRKFNSGQFHDSIIEEISPPPRKFDPSTGKPLNG